MPDKRKYSRMDLILNGGFGYLFGTIIGTLEGGLGSLAVPTSLRLINDKLDKYLDCLIKNNKKEHISWKVGEISYQATRLLTRVGIHGTTMYKMVEDIADKGDLSYGLLVIPNLISLGYEIYRNKNKEKAINLEKKLGMHF